jgi:RND family efflux transporter MFP subunit
MNETLETPRPLDEAPPPRRPGLGRVLLGIVTGVLLPLVVLAAGTAVAARFIQTKPKAGRKAPPRNARLVDVETVTRRPYRVQVRAMGTVGPARSIALHPRVSGEILSVHDEFEPGGLLEADEELLRIDASDYDLVVAQRETDVARAEADLALEKGQQSIAKREFELLGEDVPEEEGRNLVLRKPQLATVEARLAAARTALAKAKLDRDRTKVEVPLNSLVRTRDADVGTRVTPSTRLATLVGTDDYWIEATVPVDRLRWIRVPRTRGETGSTVRVTSEAAWGRGVARTGTVLRLAGDIEEQGRMARLLVRVEDPLALREENAGEPVLLLGAYVRVVIEGTEIPDVAAIHRDRIHDGNRVWILDDEDRLEIRTVEVAYRGPDLALVSSGVREGERIVVTDLAAPVEGMPLRVAKSRPGPERSPAEVAGAEGE